MENLDLIFDEVIKDKYVHKSIKDYVENLLHTLRFNRNRNIWVDFTDTIFLNDEFKTDINDLNYQTWLNALDMKQKNNEKNIEDLIRNLVILKCEFDLTSKQQAYIEIKIKKYLMDLQSECKDIAHFIYYMDLPIDQIDTDLYNKKIHKILTITTLCLFVFPYLIYLIFFSIKVKKRKWEIRQQKIAFYKKHYPEIVKCVEIVKKKNEKYFLNNNLKIKMVSEKIKNAENWIKEAEKMFKKYKIKSYQINE